ncbi:hypothetical protein KKD03_04995 [Patescibacteria group bacterium]|nr:hypothetical protein [Patescibacteria group bacterium]
MSSKQELVSRMQIEVTPLIEPDIDQFDSILRQHVWDRYTRQILEDEIASIKGYMRGEADEYGRKRKYIVAKTPSGQVVGCMAFSSPDPDMVTHFHDIDPEESVELLNAFVDSKVFRGGGVGRKLFEGICNTAKAEGKKYLLVHSGPRYKASWGFYDHLCDENRGFIVEKYGRGGDANTWLKRL